MRIAVTGASGFVGPRLVRQLADGGHTGYAISRRPMADLPHGWHWLSRSQALNGTEFASERLPVPEWLIHLEVKQHVPSPTGNDRAEFQRVNISGTREWLAWCTSLEIQKFAYFSSIKAVGESQDCQDETASAEPRTAYGSSKRAGEECVRNWVAEASSRRALILRPAVVYGPGNTANMFAMVRAMDRGRFFFVGANANVKSLVSIRNVAAAVAFLLPRVPQGVHVFNLVDRQSYTVRELACMITRLLGRKRVPHTIPVPLARIGAACGDLLARLTGRNVPLTRARLTALVETTHFPAQKLIRAGFVHPQTTDEGLAEMVNWYRGQSPRAMKRGLLR